MGRGAGQKQALKKARLSSWCVWLAPFLTMSPHETFRIKRFLARVQKQNRSVPQWIWMKTGNKIKYNSKRRHWRRSQLGP
ncbi:large ribosomal subunit protein eL39-like [Microcebus murinus]|uniref:large ribosomal subunit protein eL39-like n=1 Tax=Microcebus murinus TaxID=30608 RepID=UPI003F6D2FB9